MCKCQVNLKVSLEIMIPINHNKQRQVNFDLMMAPNEKSEDHLHYSKSS